MSPAPAPSDERRIEVELSYTILLAERLRKSVSDSVFYKVECSDVGKLADRLSTMLRSTVRLANTPGAGGQVYDRPIRRISGEVSRNLNRAICLIRRCRRRSFLHRLVRIVAAADFRKVLSLLEASVGDVTWLLSILDVAGKGGTGGGINLSLPPIVSNDPIVAWIWSFIMSVQMGEISDRIEAANELRSLSEDNDRNKKIIVEEGGIQALLKLLKENSSPEAQISAASALSSVANHRERVRVIVDHAGIPVIVQVLNDSPMRVQIRVSELVSVMAEHDSVAQEEFSRENVIRPLVSLLSFETFEGELFDGMRFSFHSIVQITNKEVEMNGGKPKPKPQLSSSLSSVYSEGGSSRGGGQQGRKDRGNETHEVKKELKISCSKALWMLAKGSISNSKSISETKGLLCLAKLMEKEEGELHRNCLMAIMEITLTAELNADLRRSAFKINSPAAKAVVDQLIRVISDVDDPALQIAAVRSIGALSRTFPARETRVIEPLVRQLSDRDDDVIATVAFALAKFASPENFLCQEHSKAIIEFNGVNPLMRLLQSGNERVQAHGLRLLCYLAINASNHEALEQARVLTALEGAVASNTTRRSLEQSQALNALEGSERCVSIHQPQMRELITKAIYHLNLYRGDVVQPRKQLSKRKSNKKG